MKFITQQLCCCTLTCWKLQSLESVESFCECPVHFLDLGLPAPQLHQFLSNLHLALFTTARFAIHVEGQLIRDTYGASWR